MASTLRVLAESSSIEPETLEALWAKLGVDPDSEADLLATAAIPDNIVDEAVSSLIREMELLPIVSGRVKLLMRKVHSLDKPLVVSPVHMTPTPKAPPTTGHKVKLSIVLDQSDDTTIDPLTIEKRAEYRANHVSLSRVAVLLQVVSRPRTSLQPWRTVLTVEIRRMSILPFSPRMGEGSFGFTSSPLRFSSTASS